MNCLEARRELLANPTASGTELQSHCRQCPGCAAFRGEILAMESDIRCALEVDVPAQLADRVLLRTRLRQPAWRPYAVAASMLLVALAALLQAPWPARESHPASWSEVILAHVLNEREALVSDGAVPATALSAALSGFGLRAERELGRIRYLQHCEMPGGKGLHVVIETAELGKVTLLLLPAGTQMGTGQSARDGFTASLMQVNGRPVGLVTEKPGKDERAHEWLRNSLRAT